jgi:preprotein translocase subunit YajC
LLAGNAVRIPLYDASIGQPQYPAVLREDRAAGHNSMECAMLISPAFAQGIGGGGDGFTAMMPLVLIFVIFYFLLIRPQQKQRRVHREMLENLRRGDEVITGGGIIAKVTKVNSETEVTVEIADDIKVTLARGTITAVVGKEDAPGDAAKGAGTSGNQKPASPLGGLLGGLFGGRK